jgi:hypothetical protein
MNINDAYPSRFLHAHELQGKSPTVTIARVDFEQVRSRTGGTETKPVVYFRGKTKGLLLNKTNARSITQIARTAVTEQWPGVAIALYATTDTFGKEVHDVIRIQAPANGKPRVSSPHVLDTELDVDLADRADDDGPRVALLAGLATPSPKGGAR